MARNCNRRETFPDIYNDPELGEFFDVFCVIQNNKPLAALDLSALGRRKYKTKYAVNKINKIIDAANKQGARMIHMNVNGGMYLKSIVFLPKNTIRAYKLMHVLWYSPKRNNLHYLIGKLLGYKVSNIKAFYKYHNKELSQQMIADAEKYLKEIPVSRITDEISRGKIKYYDSIPRL